MNWSDFVGVEFVFDVEIDDGSCWVVGIGWCYGDN